MRTLTVVYQGGRALRAIRNCVVMPTHFTSTVSKTKQIHRPGFSMMGRLFGRDRTFYVVEDQLFLVSESGNQYHVGTVQENSMRLLGIVRAQVVRYFRTERAK